MTAKSVLCRIWYFLKRLSTFKNIQKIYVLDVHHKTSLECIWHLKQLGSHIQGIFKNTTNGVRYFWFSDLYRNSEFWILYWYFSGLNMAGIRIPIDESLKQFHWYFNRPQSSIPAMQGSPTYPTPYITLLFQRGGACYNAVRSFKKCASFTLVLMGLLFYWNYFKLNVQCFWRLFLGDFLGLNLLS